MKYRLLLFLILISCRLFGQGDYYVEKSGDTVHCKFKKIYPEVIKVRSEEKGTETLKADKIREFRKDSIKFVSKRINDERKNPFIFLPDDKADRKYLYNDPILVTISGRGVTFYELTEFGGVSPYGRSITVSYYLENDSLGLTKVPYMSAIGSSVNKTDVINALFNYLHSDMAIANKLNVSESWKTFNLRGVRKLIEEFMGKKLIN